MESPVVASSSSHVDELEARLLLRQHTLTACFRRWGDRLALQLDAKRHKELVAAHFYSHRLCFALFRAWQWRFQCRVRDSRLEAAAAAFASRRVSSCLYFPMAVAGFRRWRALAARRHRQQVYLKTLRDDASRALLKRYILSFFGGRSTSWLGRAKLTVLHRCILKDTSRDLRVAYWRRWSMFSNRRARGRLVAVELGEHVELGMRARVWVWWCLRAALLRARRRERYDAAVRVLTWRREQLHLQLRYFLWLGGGYLHRADHDAVSRRNGRRCFGFVELRRMMKKTMRCHVGRCFTAWIKWREERRMEARSLIAADGLRKILLVRSFRRLARTLASRRRDVSCAEDYFKAAALRKGFCFWRCQAASSCRERVLCSKADRLGLAIRRHIGLQRLVEGAPPYSSSTMMASVLGPTSSNGRQQGSSLPLLPLDALLLRHAPCNPEDPSGIGGGALSGRSRSSSLSSLLRADDAYEPPTAGGGPLRSRPRAVSPTTIASAGEEEDGPRHGPIQLKTVPTRRPQPIPIHAGHKATLSIMTAAAQPTSSTSTTRGAGDDELLLREVRGSSFSQQKFLAVMEEYKALRRTRSADQRRIQALRTTLSSTSSSTPAGGDNGQREVMEGELARLRQRQQQMLTLRSWLRLMMAQLSEAIVQADSTNSEGS